MSAGDAERGRVQRELQSGSLKEAVGKLVGSGGVNVVIDMVGGDVFLDALRR